MGQLLGNHFRLAALGKGGDGTTFALGVDWMVKGLEAKGAQATVLSRNPNQTPPGDVRAQIDAALEKGHPLLLGSAATYDAWGAAQEAKGNYLPPAPEGHWVAVLGKQGDNYIVADPLVKGGTILVSPTELETLIKKSHGVDLIEVGKP